MKGIMNTIEVLNPEVVGAELVKVEQSSGLAADDALSLRGNFSSYYDEIVQWREKTALITQPDDETHQKIAREVRLGLRKVRCEIENVRKKLKADSLAKGKAIDGFANVLKYLTEPIEEKLLEIEQYAERKEAARIAALISERTRALVDAGGDPSAYNLGNMNEETFGIVIASAKKAKAEANAAAEKAEADRIAREEAEAAERERIRKENAKLKKEAAAAEAKAAAERAKIEAERYKERKQAEARQRELEAKATAEREAREKAEAEAAAVRAAERAKIEAEAEARAAAERAPDKQKIITFIDSVERCKTPIMMTIAGREAMSNIKGIRQKFLDFCRHQVESL